MKCFRNPFGLVGGLTFEERPEEFEGSLNQSSRGKTAATAADTLVGVHDEQSMEIFLWFVSLWPATIHGRTGEWADVNADNLHAEISESGF